MGTDKRDRGHEPHDKGKNLGQGLAGITDKDRRDLVGRGDKAPTKDQSGTSTEKRHVGGDQRDSGDRR